MKLYHGDKSEIYRSLTNMMIGEINQKNLYLLLPSKVCRLATMLQENDNLQLIDAIKRVYSSDTYKLMEQEDTKIWHLGPVDLYREMTFQQSKE